MKKVISLALSFILLFTVTVPAFAANEKIVTIYIAGRGTADYVDAEGNIVADQNKINRGEYIKEQAGPVLEELVKALATDDYSDYIDSFEAAFAPIYEKMLLDEDGNPANGVHITWDYKTAPIVATSETGIKSYVFKYDWRLSPIEVADQLDHYIKRVMSATNADKINIYSRCYGVNVAMTYVTRSLNGKYGDFVVNHLFQDTPGLGGYLLVAGLLSGSIVFDKDKIDRFVTYYLEGSDIFEDPTLESFASALVSILNTAKLLGWGTEVIEKIYKNVTPELISRLALCSTYGRTLAYWAMMGEYYEEAMETVFYTDELKAKYSGLIEKADAYYDILIKDEAYKKVLLTLDSMGVKTAVVAKYGTITFPLFEDSEITGDVRGTVTQGSYGATAVDFHKTLSDKYIKNAEEAGTAKYISPDKQIDASTALFPDRTWFIKNIAHDCFPARIAQLGQEFFNSDGTLTVWNSSLPQYMDYETGLQEVVPSEKPVTSWTDNPFANLLKFFTSLLNLLKGLLFK